MTMPNRRTMMLIALALLVLVILGLSFRAPPVLVDSALVERGPFRVTVEEEGRTRLPDRYVVSVPVAGYLHRIALEPGDAIARGDTLFVLNPSPVEALDPEARVRAELGRAEAALAVAQAQVASAQAEAELAARELERVAGLVANGHLPEEQLDRARARNNAAQASLRSARFGVDVARHELEAARSVLSLASDGQEAQLLEIGAPIDGVVLTRERQSAGRVQAGETLMVLGDLAGLQVEVDLLSQDAVRLSPGMSVELERWGGDTLLTGRVRRIEPAAFTHISALGVEEQRVWVIVDFTGAQEDWQALGDGYRVQARFILWEGEEVLQTPASALFREGDTWATYVIEDGRAVRRVVEPGRRAGLMVEVKAGLEEGERVVLHPGQDVEPGSRIDMGD